MDLRRALCSLSLFVALLPVLLGELSCSGGPSGITSAPAPAGPSEQAPGALAGDGLAAAQRHIAEREYRASSNSQGLQAPNRAHNLRTYFEPTGIRVHDRTRAGSPKLLALNLTGVGRGEALARVGPGEVTSNGARVEIRRPELVEWYENSPAGLEQGFTLAKRHVGQGPLRQREALLETGWGVLVPLDQLRAVDLDARAVACDLTGPDPSECLATADTHQVQRE